MPEPIAVNHEASMATIRLIHGAAPHWICFHRDQPSRFTVGSDARATLRVERSDVAPHQFEVVWDGRQLWLQDGLRLGRTFVNGRTLNEWLPIVGQALVCFGGVRLYVSTRTAPPDLQAPDFDALDREGLTDDHPRDVRLSETSRITLTPELLREINEQDAL